MKNYESFLNKFNKYSKKGRIIVQSPGQLGIDLKFNPNVVDVALVELTVYNQPTCSHTDDTVTYEVVANTVTKTYTLMVKWNVTQLREIIWSAKYDKNIP